MLSIILNVYVLLVGLECFGSNLRQCYASDVSMYVLSSIICIQTRCCVSSGKTLPCKNDEICHNTYINIDLTPEAKMSSCISPWKTPEWLTGLNISHFIVVPLTLLDTRRRKTRVVPLRTRSKRTVFSSWFWHFKKNIIYDYYVTYISTNDISHICAVLLIGDWPGEGVADK